jgi:hypothetical protein
LKKPVPNGAQKVSVQNLPTGDLVPKSKQQANVQKLTLRREPPDESKEWPREANEWPKRKLVQDSKARLVAMPKLKERG